MQAHRSIPGSIVSRVLPALPLLTLPWLPAGGTSQMSNRTPAEQTPETARFYWKYAALAASAHNSGGRFDTQLATVTTSPWLRKELRESKDSAAQQAFENAMREEEQTLFRVQAQEGSQALHLGSQGIWLATLDLALADADSRASPAPFLNVWPRSTSMPVPGRCLPGPARPSMPPLPSTQESPSC